MYRIVNASRFFAVNVLEVHNKNDRPLRVIRQLSIVDSFDYFLVTVHSF